VKSETRYFIGRVTIHPREPQPSGKEGIPKEYRQHEKVFSKEKSQ
jgi:hypothetical protein